MLKLFNGVYASDSKEAKPILAAINKAAAVGNWIRVVKLIGKFNKFANCDAYGFEYMESGEHRFTADPRKAVLAIVPKNKTFTFEAFMAGIDKPWMGGYTNNSFSYAIIGDNGFNWVENIGGNK